MARRKEFLYWFARKSRGENKNQEAASVFGLAISVFVVQKGVLSIAHAVSFFVTRQKWSSETSLCFVAALVGVFSLYLIFGYGADLIVTALGFAYPAYQSWVWESNTACSLNHPVIDIHYRICC